MELSEIDAGLSNVDFQYRLKAISALRVFDPETAVPILIASLHDQEFLVRSFVARELGQQQTAASFAALLEMTKFDDTPNVRAEAANSLSLFGQVSISHLVSVFCQDDHWLVRRSILAALEELDCRWTGVEDLRPLAHLPLKVLRCANTRVTDLTPLQGMALIELDIAATQVRDVSVLKGMPLTALRCELTPLRDLEPLRNAPLKTLWCDPRALRSELVRSWEKIETINGQLNSAKGRSGDRPRRQTGSICRISRSKLSRASP